MLRKGFIKPEISIEKLGKRKFWTGIIIGTASSFVLAYFLNYSREALRMITSTTSDLLILSDQAFRLYDLFFAALATSIGFGFTIIIWLVGRKAGAGKRHFQILAVSNVWLVSFIALMAVSRMGITLTMMLYGLPAYDNHLSRIRDFWPILLLIPVYIYFIHWNTIRLIYRTKHWVALSGAICLIMIFVLFQLTPVDRSVLNQSYDADTLIPEKIVIHKLKADSNYEKHHPLPPKFK